MKGKWQLSTWSWGKDKVNTLSNMWFKDTHFKELTSELKKKLQNRSFTNSARLLAIDMFSSQCVSFFFVVPL